MSAYSPGCRANRPGINQQQIQGCVLCQTRQGPLRRLYTSPGKIHSAKRRAAVIESLYQYTPASTSLQTSKERSEQGRERKNVRDSVAARACTHTQCCFAGPARNEAAQLYDPCLAPNPVVTSYRRWPYGLRLPRTGVGGRDDGRGRLAGWLASAGLVGAR
jgi:hypothetical protein